MIKLLNNRSDFKKIAKKIGVSSGGVAIMSEKSKLYYFYLKEIKTPACNILKQDLLSIGADLAVEKDCVVCGSKVSDALMIVNKKQLKMIIKKMKAQPFGLKVLSEELESFLELDREITPQIMGVINANDDSFYSGSRFSGSEAIKVVKSMIEDGATIIDIGGVSSRPGSEYVGEDEEFKRVKPIIDEIYKSKLFERVELSLDSFSPKCLRYALENGFSIVNDITALKSDEVAKVASEFSAKVVLMHKKGTPKDMQENPYYDDVILEVSEFFEKRIEKAQKFGIKDIILDVGIGFGKRLEDNIELIKNLEHFKKFGFPLLVGVSRKSMIDMIIKTPVEERLAGSLSLHQMALENGAEILRVHDVKEHKQMLEIVKAFR